MSEKKTNFPRALVELGHVIEFVDLCKAGASKQEILEWINKKPDLKARAFIPNDFKTARQKFNCAGSHGGKRPPARNRGYSVARIINRWG